MTDEPGAWAIPEVTQWLRATIEGDLMRALSLPRGPWHVELLGDEGYPQRICNARAVLIAETYEGGTPTIADHVAVHDSRDTIARCEADLLLVDHCEMAMDSPETYNHMARTLADDVLRVLASGYQHRPGYGSWLQKEGKAS